MICTHRDTTVDIATKRPQMAIWAIGGLEPHVPHLPLGTDVLIVDALAQQVAERLGDVYLLPTFPFGVSIFHRGTIGAVSLRFETLMAVVRDVVESLYTQRISKVAVINNIGVVEGASVMPFQNRVVKTAVRQINYDYPESQVIWVHPASVARESLRDILGESDSDLHAGELESSLMLYLYPKLVKDIPQGYVPALPRGCLSYLPLSVLAPQGIWGRPDLASVEKGRLAFEAMVQETVRYIRRSFSILERMKKEVEIHG